ncbi:MAG TPA: BON domain-containing protein [Candidatus Binatia bacterium]|nr:BON domain-containing protein [Candidatus Binatia bacterium]
MKYCIVCRQGFLETDIFCPTHGLRLRSVEGDAAAQCAGCASVIERGEEFCRRCGSEVSDKDWSPGLGDTARVKDEQPERTASRENDQPEQPQSEDAWPPIRHQTDADFEDEGLRLRPFRRQAPPPPRPKLSRRHLELGGLLAAVVIVGGSLLAWQNFTPDESANQFASLPATPAGPEKTTPAAPPREQRMPAAEEKLQPPLTEERVEPVRETQHNFSTPPEQASGHLGGVQEQAPAQSDDSASVESREEKKAGADSRVATSGDNSIKKPERSKQPIQNSETNVAKNQPPVVSSPNGVRFASAEEIQRKRLEMERKSPTGAAQNQRSVTSPSDGVRFASAEEIQRKRLEVDRKRVQQQIQDAIANRGVSGVAVAFVNGTVFLGGQVQTANQKAAAEEAARQVPEVRDIRNSISVRWAQMSRSEAP